MAGIEATGTQLAHVGAGSCLSGKERAALEAASPTSPPASAPHFSSATVPPSLMTIASAHTRTTCSSILTVPDVAESTNTLQGTDTTSPTATSPNSTFTSNGIHTSPTPSSAFPGPFCSDNLFGLWQCSLFSSCVISTAQ
ncbi:unnamed protein product [Closterium sp. Yama58-4]|nr:unnamed protein product [Closterium sp. Yama58-4]